jgi:hypothetical protein
MFNKLLNFVDNFNNYLLFNQSNPNTNIHSPHRLLTEDTNLGQNSLSIYNHPPPGFKNIINSAAITPNSNFANADTKASGTYIATRDTNSLHNIISCTTTSQISVQVANGQIITSSHVGDLQVPDGSKLRAYMFAGISGSLLSVSQLVDIGFIVTYNSNNVEFIKNNYRDAITLLWMIDLSTFSHHIAPTMPAHPFLPAAAAATILVSPAVRLQSKEEHVRYWHVCFGFLSKSTFVCALKDWLKVPGLTAVDVKKAPA